MQVVFSNRAYLSILAETSERIKTETGGIFLGCHENGNWYVVEAIDPGPKSVFQATYFEYDQKYTQHLINKIARLYRAKLGLIGLWHRHPGSFDEFSSTDDGTNSDYAKSTPAGAISALVNIDPHFRITPYHVAWPLRYAKVSYKVGDDLIPAYLLQMKNAEQSLEFINGYADKSFASSGSSPASRSKTDFVLLLEAIRKKLSAVPFQITGEDIRPEDAGTHKDVLIDALLDDITYFSESRGLSLKVEQNEGSLSLSHKGANGTVTKIYFVYLAKRNQIVFSYGDNFYSYTPGLFSGLLANYEPPVVTFKSELMRALGFGKGHGENADG